MFNFLIYSDMKRYIEFLKENNIDGRTIKI